MFLSCFLLVRTHRALWQGLVAVCVFGIVCVAPLHYNVVFPFFLLGRIELSGKVSSQFVSSVLLSAPYSPPQYSFPAVVCVVSFISYNAHRVNPWPEAELRARFFFVRPNRALWQSLLPIRLFGAALGALLYTILLGLTHIRIFIYIYMYVCV